jgi:anthranilate synthase/aminodeoxychorismate synthase-like glutamine amidotransferase
MRLRGIMILLIDNYDSFVYNLARYFERLGYATQVVRNDSIDVASARALAPSALVLSPGPCTPNEAGCSLALVRELWQEVPMLGICLGHQTIAAAWDGRIVRAPEPMHGRTSRVWHRGQGIFAGVPDPVTVCRYHSLIADEASLPECLEVTARTVDGLIMAIQHHTAPVVGLQFHPEAILTEYGYRMLANFLALARLDAFDRSLPLADEFPAPRTAADPHADSAYRHPITF